MSGPRFKSVAPVLCVNEIAPVRDYLVERLGFAVQGQVGEPPAWASLCRNTVEIMLACVPPPVVPVPDWAVYIYLDSKADIDALHAEFRTRGADIVGDPVDKPYDCREFEVRLPDGRLIAFGG